MLFSLITILPFAACLFWLAVLLLDWRRNNAAQHVLAAFMAASMCLYFCHAVYFNHDPALAAVANCVYAFCNIAVFPLYYLYVSRLTDNHPVGPRALVALLPAAAIGLWAAALALWWPADAEAERVRQTAMRVLFIVQLVPICWRGTRRLAAFDLKVANYYADTENRTLRPTERMMWVLVVGAAMSSVANVIGREFFDDSAALLCVPSLLFTMLLFSVGYVGTRQKFCVDDLLRDEAVPEPLAPESDAEPEADPSEEASTLMRRLDAMMEEQRLYLQPDLRLADVAAALGVGRTTLSQRINQERRQTFSDYVNALRIAHACRLLEQPNPPILSVVAERSGFSSDSSFYRAFRRHTGRTPRGSQR